jgi:hypothetical protein
MQTTGYEQSLGELVQLANEKQILLMCAEAVPWRCHRSQMAMSMAFHIVCAALGIGMPLLMAFAEGMYLYGSNRLSHFLHWLSGVVAAVSGIFSGISVVTANAWMNAPAGLQGRGGQVMLAFSGCASGLWWKRRPLANHPWLLRALAATYLTLDTKEHPDLQSDFRRRALWLKLALAPVALEVFLLSKQDAPEMCQF